MTAGNAGSASSQFWAAIIQPSTPVQIRGEKRTQYRIVLVTEPSEHLCDKRFIRSTLVAAIGSLITPVDGRF